MKLDAKKGINRLVIYFFYDADGIVDRYVPYMLEDINRNCTELFVVCNGKLTPEGRETFLKFTPHILVRENVGFDVWAYKESLEHYGWDKLEEFDEVIMMNHTIMGPVYPLSEMFEDMDQRELDFWGINKFHKVMYNPYGTKYGYLPEHIQSHFIAVRNSMIKSIEFQDYWDSRPEIKDYADAVGQHESIFTKTFSDFGFKWKCYIDTTDMAEFTHYPLIMTPLEIVRERRCPVFKRRSFFQPCADLISYTDANQGMQLLDFLEHDTEYDISMIWENLIRTTNMADLKNCLNLNYILPLNETVYKKAEKRIALVIHIYSEDMIEYCYRYALSMPKESDVYLTSNTEAKCRKIEDAFHGGPWNHVRVIQIENRGRDVSSLLIGVKPYLNKYDYVCFLHDKKVPQLDYGSKGFAFSERCYHNMIGSPELVYNIIDLFEKNPFLGLLCPPPPNHADYYSTLGCEWGMSFETTKKLAEDLDITSSIRQDKEPIAPLGTMFWFRPKALRKLLDYDWKYEDFPKEPIATDGTLLHAVERIYPFAAQDEGFYSAWALSDVYTRAEWSHLSYMLRELNTRVFRVYGINSFWGLVTIIDYYLFNNDPNSPIPNMKYVLKRTLKAKLPKPIWNFMRRIYCLFSGKKWIG